MPLADPNKTHTGLAFLHAFSYTLYICPYARSKMPSLSPPSRSESDCTSLTEPIAIIGIGCRYAGSVSGPRTLWDLLTHPRDVSSEIPSSRFSVSGFYHSDPAHHGTTDSIRSHFLNQNHKTFDAPFFNIAAREATAIDPLVSIKYPCTIAGTPLIFGSNASFLKWSTKVLKMPACNSNTCVALTPVYL